MARRIGFPTFAARNLFVRTKAGAIAPFRLNAVQRALHARIEAQRARTGRVRVLVLKARQPGVSTYVEGRFYWLVTRGRGVRAFILTHMRDATDAIFEMVERFHARNPDPARPHVGAANASELLFDEIDSGYRVGTAGSRAVGRGHTIQFFHGSEVAHWPNAGTHMAGVPDADGTEVILESTANGPGGLFHDLCRAALRRRFRAGVHPVVRARRVPCPPARALDAAAGLGGVRRDPRAEARPALLGVAQERRAGNPPRRREEKP